MTFIDGESQVVEPLPEPAKLRDIIKPARTLGATADHWQELDGAMDAAFSGTVMPSFEFSVLSGFTTFVGYGVLQQLSQDALIRLCIQTRTDEMLRSWIEIKCEDEERKQTLEKAIADYRIKDTLSQTLTLMGLMGGAYLYIDTGTDKPVEILNKTSKSAEIKPNRTLAFRVVDPIFTTATLKRLRDALQKES